MAGDAKKLQAALLQKEKNQNYLSNLERLKVNGSVTTDQYETMKTGYHQNMTASVSEIANIKSSLKLQLQATQQNISSIRMELENLNLKHKVGELSLEKYQQTQQKLTRTISKNETAVNDIQKLIAAKSSAQVAFISPSAGFSLPNSSMTMPDFTAEDVLSPLGIAAFIIAAIMLIALLFLPVYTVWGIEAGTLMKANVGIGIVCLLASLGYAGAVFIKEQKVRAMAHLIIGGIAILILIAFLFMSWQTLREYGFESGLFKTLASGFWLYGLASIAGIVVGVVEIRD